MGSKNHAAAALVLGLSLLFLSFVTATTTNCGCSTPPSPTTPKPPTPSVPKTPQTPKPTPPSPGVPSIGTCPRDALKLGVCINLLNGLVGVVIGTPSNTPCCTLLQGLVDLDAALCLCTAIRANILGIILNVPVSLSLILNACGHKVPSGFQCG